MQLEEACRQLVQKPFGSHGMQGTSSLAGDTTHCEMLADLQSAAPHMQKCMADRLGEREQANGKQNHAHLFGGH